MNFKTRIFSKISFKIRIKLFLLSIGGSILILYPIHTFLVLLGLCYMYPVFTAINLCIIMVSSLFIQGKDPPSCYFLVTSFVTTLIFGAILYYFFIPYTINLLHHLPAGFIACYMIDNNTISDRWRFPHHDIRTQPHIFLARLYDIKVFVLKKMDNIEWGVREYNNYKQFYIHHTGIGERELANRAARGCLEKKEYVLTEYHLFDTATRERNNIIRELHDNFQGQPDQVNPLIRPYQGGTEERVTMEQANYCANDRTV